MTINGEEKKMTEEEVRSYRQHTNRGIREEAYRSLRRVYNSKQNRHKMVWGLYHNVLEKYTR